MKKFLLMALAVAAIVSCRETITPAGENPEPEPVVPDRTAPMLLSVGGNLQTRAGGIGIRNYKFEVGDIIGVYAALCKVDGANAVADWTNIYFANKPATFQEGTEPTVDSLSFAWGVPGDIGTLKNNQFYPAKDRSVFVYAYYPYSSKADSVKLSDVCTSTGITVPTRFFSLVEGAVGESVDATDTKNYVNRTQPDYMWAVGKSMDANDIGGSQVALDSVRRTLRLDTMTFKHALAQINFGVYLSDENASSCRFDSIRIIIPKNGAYDLISGNTKIVPATSTPAATDSVEYILTARSGETVKPLPKGTTTPSLPNVLDILKSFPLMVLPMSEADFRGCRIEIVVSYGDVGVDDRKTYVLNMKDQAVVKPIKKGFYNTVYLGIGQTEVKLFCNVDPWKMNDPADDNILPVE